MTPAPENTFGRQGLAQRDDDASTAPAFAVSGEFKHIPEVGNGGRAALGLGRLPSFLNLTKTRLQGAAAFCGDSPTSHYCH